VALVVKELRWRMRGRRAYVVITVYVGLLALLVFSMYGLAVQSATLQFGPDGPVRTDLVSAGVSAAIGQGVFAVLLVLQTLLTLLLAPALTAGAISTEREKQTLELLITTPVSTLGMVVGKLISSLAYVLVLILASIPLMSLVFAFGGIAPDDVVRAYVMLFVVAFGVGSIGMFLSAWLKRTQLATAITFVIVFTISFALPLVHGYSYLSSRTFDPETGQMREPQPPSELMVWLSPLAADIDLMCTAVPDSYGTTCQYSAVVVGAGVVDPQNPPRDMLWPRIALALIVLGIVLTLGATQMITSSRRVKRQRPPPSEPVVEGVTAA
jgi:ABC-type transport system involved in multi-copper enzyme maturation permease subunit